MDRKNNNNRGLAHRSRGRLRNRNNGDSAVVENLNTPNRNRNHPRSYTSSEDTNFKFKGRKPPFIGFKYLENLLDQPVEDVMQKLCENKGFYDLLEKNLSNDFIVLVIKLMNKFCECEFSSIRNQILQKTLTVRFIGNLHIYISSLAIQGAEDKKRNSLFWKDTDSFWNNFLLICETAIQEMPQTFGKSLSDLLKIVDLNLLQIEQKHNMHINDSIKTKLKNLVKTAEVKIVELQRQKAIPVSKNDEGEPPDDFHEISVYPTTKELTSDERPFLRRNVVEGPYRSINHYLDVQFRLLREDFVGPLREGIMAYISNTNSKVQNVKIHNKVQFIQPLTLTEHYCALLKFNLGKGKNSFAYENSRRFMFGSLVCFTRDNFKTILFGKIVSRDEKYLKNKEIVIGFDTNEDLRFNTDYIMIECAVYFEPYYHVLNVMKHIREEDFPMKNYLIDVMTEATLPAYIRPDTRFLIENQYSHNISWYPIDAIKNRFFNFNDSQNEAFIAALTREFSIIQGPPGTGKTYVGLKIAKTLLKNSIHWNAKSPMLVICYTNHALDQFLEGLLDTTKELVRIGGQSKNEKLNEYNLKNYSRRFRRHYNNNLEFNVTISLSRIKKINNILNMLRSFDCIIHFREFKEIIPNYDKSWLSSASDEAIIDWLMGTQEDIAIKEDSDLVQGMNNLFIREINNTVKNEDEEDGIFEDSDDNNDNDDEIQDFLDSIHIPEKQPILSLSEMSRKIDENEENLRCLNTQLEIGNFDVYFSFINLENETRHLLNKYEYLKKRLDSARKTTNIQGPNVTAENSQYIPMNERWNFYVYWIREYYNALLKKCDFANIEFRRAYKVYQDSKELENVKILRNAEVIGMTTTGAARLHSSLQMLKSPIVIVEEAAEVLEAHIVSSLTKHCKQLILIGDHQQLKPSTSNYRVEKFYDLGISLFERMILNKVQCFTLNIQHRMRPEISALIKPAIYPNLQDHETVLNRPQIMGIEKCLYFIDHQHREESLDTTKKNKHEAEYLIKLARYLIQNGYKPEHITILAAYLGQMFEMQRQRNNYGDALLKEVKITVLDNYQGEESDIILLSLVRNNTENKIGFLSIDNRVCVALSRARNGLFIMGNMTQLCEKSELWQKIKQTFTQQDAIGPSLNLKCEIHKKITKISEIDDFRSVAEGGCDQLCGILLSCGHYCKRLCHILDREHAESRCPEKCLKSLCDANETHLCQKMCFEDCGPCEYPVKKTLLCNHEATIFCHLEVEKYDCRVELEVTLPCGHDAVKPCFVDIEKQKCPVPCDTRLDCGHACVRNCHVRDDPDHLEYKCTKKCGKSRKGCTKLDDDTHMCPKLCWEECIKCEINVKKGRTKCPHYYDVPCWKDPDEIECHKPCKKQLPCGHNCESKCYKPCGLCEKKVKKVIDGCNHIVSLPCYKEPDKQYCRGQCPRIMTCGHKCTQKCNEVCDPMKCRQMVDVLIPGKCGHLITRIPCYMFSLYKSKDLGEKDNIEKYCREPCRTTLNCSKENKHLCSGTCGECFQGRIHKRCSQKCGQILVCNHECEISCRETCKPCQKQCSFRCKHSVCKKRCGEPCKFCKESCNRKCVHKKCIRSCGAICSISPCEQPCEKKLDCGHKCVGFCGDPCPPKCRVCDKEELEEFFFGTEDEEDARFVLLKDCGHILESSGMEQWLAQDENEIKFKVCPKCKTTINTTERYSDHVKRAIMDIMRVKEQQYGKKEDNDAKRLLLLKNINDLRETISVSHGYGNVQILWKYLDTLSSRLRESDKKGRKQPCNSMEINAIEIKFQLSEEICKILNEDEGRSGSYRKEIDLQVNFIFENLLRQLDDITENEIEDIQRETNRLVHMIRLGSMINITNLPGEAREKIENVKKLIHTLAKFEKALDEKIREELKVIAKMSNSTLGITEIERREIVKAIGLSKGHWFKCPNGHPYAIADCGGAMVESKCNECQAPIGGTHHRLLSTNALASEMDGAQHAAWSETANMANYGFFRNAF